MCPADMDEKWFGSGEFRQRSKVSAEQMRALESVGIIHPLRSGSGWRMFREADVEAARQWKARQVQQRGGWPRKRGNGKTTKARLRSSGTA